MPIINPDLSSNAALEPGVYPGKILKADPGISKKNNPVVKIEVEVTANGETRTLFGSHPTSGRGTFVFEQLLRASGFDEVADKLLGGPGVPFNTDDLIGQNVMVQVGNQMYNGRMTDSIDGYLKQ